MRVGVTEKRFVNMNIFVSEIEMQVATTPDETPVTKEESAEISKPRRQFGQLTV